MLTTNTTSATTSTVAFNSIRVSVSNKTLKPCSFIVSSIQSSVCVVTTSIITEIISKKARKEFLQEQREKVLFEKIRLQKYVQSLLNKKEDSNMKVNLKSLSKSMEEYIAFKEIEGEIKRYSVLQEIAMDNTEKVERPDDKLHNLIKDAKIEVENCTEKVRFKVNKKRASITIRKFNNEKVTEVNYKQLLKEDCKVTITKENKDINTEVSLLLSEIQDNLKETTSIFDRIKFQKVLQKFEQFYTYRVDLSAKYVSLETEDIDGEIIKTEEKEPLINVYAQPEGENGLLRMAKALNSFNKKMKFRALNGDTVTRPGTDLFITVQIKVQDEKDEALYLDVLEKDNGIYLYTNKLGEGSVFFNLKEAPIGAKLYKFFNCSASGLKTITLKFMKTGIVETDGANKELNENDIRFKTLNKLTANALDKMGLKTMSEIFKLLNRTGNTLAPQHFLSKKCQNFIIFNSFGTGEFDKTSDGYTFLSGEYVADALTETGLKTFIEYVLGMTIQHRLTNCKCAGDIMKRKDIVNFALSLILVGRKITKIIVDGIGYDIDYKENNLPTDESMILIKKCLKNLEAVLDDNACKINEFDYHQTYLTILSTAKLTDGTISEQMLTKFVKVDKEATFTFLEKKWKEHVTDKFNNIFNHESRLSNVDYDIQYLCDVMPQAIKENPTIYAQVMKNTVQSLQNDLIKFHIPIDSAFMVVVPDICASMLGIRVFDIHEAYITDNPKKVKEIMAMRYPSSDNEAIHYFKILTKTELLERLNNIIKENNIPKGIADFLMNYYLRSKKVLITPAFKKLQDKLDGFDFDIDKFIAIAQKELVKIGKKIEDKYVAIDRTNEDAITFKHLKDRNEFDIDSLGLEDEDLSKIIIDEKLPITMENLSKAAARTLKNRLASVGPITNNCTKLTLALLTMKYGTEIQKTAIIDFFRLNCSGKENNKYERLLIKDKDNVVTVRKTTGYDIVNSFKDSEKTEETVIAFLEDAIIYHRYMIESSIDAVKNDYHFDFLFKFNNLVMLGLSKDGRINLLKEEKFLDQFKKIEEQIIERDGSSSIIKYIGNGGGLSLLSWNPTHEEKFPTEDDDSCVIFDIIAQEKKKLMNMTNYFIVQEIRKTAINFIKLEKDNKILHEKDFVKYDWFGAMQELRKYYGLIALDYINTIQKLERIYNDEDSNHTDKETMDMLRREAGEAFDKRIKALKSTANKIFRDVPYQLLAQASIALSRSKTQTGLFASNKFFMNIFGDKVIKHFEEKYSNKFVGKTGTQIISNDKNGEAKIKISAVIGKEVDVENGITNWIDFEEEKSSVRFYTFETKKSMHGTIEKIDNKLYVIADREKTIEENEDYIIIKVAKFLDKDHKDIDDFFTDENIKIKGLLFTKVAVCDKNNNVKSVGFGKNTTKELITNKKNNIQKAIVAIYEKDEQIFNKVIATVNFDKTNKDKEGRIFKLIDNKLIGKNDIQILRIGSKSYTKTTLLMLDYETLKEQDIIEDTKTIEAEAKQKLIGSSVESDSLGFSDEIEEEEIEEETINMKDKLKVLFGDDNDMLIEDELPDENLLDEYDDTENDEIHENNMFENIDDDMEL